MHEHVGHLEVAMYDVLLGEVVQSLEDIPDNGLGLELVEVTVLAQSGLEVALVAQLRDDVAVTVTCEHLETF